MEVASHVDPGCKFPVSVRTFSRVIDTTPKETKSGKHTLKGAMISFASVEQRTLDRSKTWGKQSALTMPGMPSANTERCAFVGGFGFPSTQLARTLGAANISRRTGLPRIFGLGRDSRATPFS